MINQPLRALIVDDEEMARKDLSNYLARHDSITIVGEAADIDAAIKQITALKPDVVFLDIQMPGAAASNY